MRKNSQDAASAENQAEAWKLSPPEAMESQGIFSALPGKEKRKRRRKFKEDIFYNIKKLET